MSKAAALFSMAIAIFYFGSCTKDKTATPVTCIQADTLNTYTKSVKAILDYECTPGCHDATVANSGVRLDDYSHAVSSAKTDSKFFCVMDFTCTPHMPNGYTSPIDTSEINAIKRWRDNCYAQ